MAAPAVTGGCSLLVDTSGLSLGEPTGHDGAGARDGGGTIADADADVDAAADAGGDAGADADPGPCTDDPVHCETFDEGDILARHSVSTDPTTSISVDDALAVSAPRSAKFVIEPSTSNGSPDATLAFTTATAVASFVIEASVRIEREEPDEAAQLLRLAHAGGAVVTLQRSGKVRDSSALVGQVGPVPTGRWVAIRLEVKPPTGTLTVEGADPAVAEFPVAWTEERRAIVRFGISEANSPTTGWIVRWDDVIVRSL